MGSFSFRVPIAGFGRMKTPTCPLAFARRIVRTARSMSWVGSTATAKSRSGAKLQYSAIQSL